MKCFYHQERDAVGTCKSCGKGVCADCAVDLGKGLACRERCEEEVKALISLIDQNIRLTPAAGRTLGMNRRFYMILAFFLLIPGAVIVLGGVAGKSPDAAGIVLGGFLALFGLLFLTQALRLPTQRMTSARE